MHVSVRGGGWGGAKDTQRRGDIGARADGYVVETTHEAEVDFLSHSGKGGGAMCARPARKPGGIGRDDGVEAVMPYLAKLSRRYLD
jgi:hypothetical protein